MPKKAASKTRYTCPACGLDAWAKRAVQLMCGDCRGEMQGPDEDADADEAD